MDPGSKAHIKGFQFGITRLKHLTIHFPQGTVNNMQLHLSRA